MDSAVSPSLSLVSVLSLLVCSLQVLAAVLLTGMFSGQSSPMDRWVLLWLFYDVIVHLTLVGGICSFLFVVFSMSQFLFIESFVWKEYSKADSRWLVSDPIIVSVEILTVVLVSLIALLLIHAILNDKYYRHFLQIALSVCELYGGWMTFCPDWLLGSPHLDTSNWLHLWIYLLFFNGLWVLVPILLLLQSWFRLRNLHALRSDTTATKKKKKL
uniref:EBP like n=1 Tax=Kryptolebias marmoratus TaxID=37003 RepID=A0A3Q3EHV2_KRYMA